MCQLVLIYPEMSQHVNVEDPSNFLGRVIKEGVAGHYTSIVNQDGNVTDFLFDFFGYAEDLLPLRYVASVEGNKDASLELDRIDSVEVIISTVALLEKGRVGLSRFAEER